MDNALTAGAIMPLYFDILQRPNISSARHVGLLETRWNSPKRAKTIPIIRTTPRCKSPVLQAALQCPRFKAWWQTSFCWWPGLVPKGPCSRHVRVLGRKPKHQKKSAACTKCTPHPRSCSRLTKESISTDIK